MDSNLYLILQEKEVTFAKSLVINKLKVFA